MNDVICVSYFAVTGVNMGLNMLTGGVSVLGWVVGYKARGLMGWIESLCAWLNALEARMRVHAVNMRRTFEIYVKLLKVLKYKLE